MGRSVSRGSVRNHLEDSLWPRRTLTTRLAIDHKSRKKRRIDYLLPYSASMPMMQYRPQMSFAGLLATLKKGRKIKAPT